MLSLTEPILLSIWTKKRSYSILPEGDLIGKICLLRLGFVNGMRL